MEEALSNQLDKMTFLMDESLIPSQSPQNLPSTLRNKVTMVPRTVDVDGFPHNGADLDATAAHYLIFLHQETTLSPQ